MALSVHAGIDLFIDDFEGLTSCGVVQDSLRAHGDIDSTVISDNDWFGVPR